ncbi:hypothetical protein KUCAC02_012077 [Chaenocephalus aceratus]|uniref:Uncharacterized protein n=1 Tax=Chaenocephalus aceratus TaxID=36190 RepID=A0ACB9XBI9_CHAAC|nr:hypothetical protein KUCAC02_012077 [Chaenocephalus aceratus]
MRDAPEESVAFHAQNNNTSASSALSASLISGKRAPISDSLAHHLRERHQQHDASTITLHLVHCRGVGTTQNGQESRAAHTRLGSARPRAALRNGPALISSDSSAPKRRKPPGERANPRDNTEGVPNAVISIKRRIPHSGEVEKLAANLWLWKSDTFSATL